MAKQRRTGLRRCLRKAADYTHRASIRIKTICLFVVLVLLILLVFGGACLGMIVRFDRKDVELVQEDVARLALAVIGNAQDIAQNVMNYAAWDDTAAAVDDYIASNRTASSELFEYYWLSCFAYDGWQYDVGVNIVAIYDRSWHHVQSTYFPANSTESIAGPLEATVPTFFRIGDVDKLGSGFAGLVNPPAMGGTASPSMIVAVEPITYTTIGDTSVHGYLLFGKALRPDMQSMADSVPTCLSSWLFSDIFEVDVPDEALAVLPGLEAAKITADGKWTGTPLVVAMPTSELLVQEARLCPHVPLVESNSTSLSHAAYMLLADGFDGHPSGPLIRIDRPRIQRATATGPVLYALLWSVVILLIVGLFCILYIDFVVLRRVDRLSQVVLESTVPVSRMAGQTAPPAVVVFAATDTSETTRHDDDGSGSTFSSLTSPRSADATKANEIEQLRNAVKANIVGANQRITEASAALQEEGRRRVRHRDAMRLLNLWCHRAGNRFPGLRTAARTDPRTPHSFTLDRLLANPIAIEFLKAHCRAESSLENLQFLIDIAWLNELEAEEDAETNLEAKQSLHSTAENLAKSIQTRYFTRGATQELNLGGDIANKLQNAPYTRKMFDEPSILIRYGFDTDVLPRFQRTVAFVALCEVLDIEAGSSVILPTTTADDSERRPSEIEITPIDASGGHNAISQAFSRVFYRLRLRSLASPTEAERLPSPPQLT